MKPFIPFAAAALAIIATGASAQSLNAYGGSLQSSPGKVQYSAKVRGEATVTSISQKTRKVTLRRPDGGSTTVTAGPEIKNLARIKVGDKVIANYRESLEVSLLKGAKQPVGQHQDVSDRTAKRGALPGGESTTKTVMTGNVVKIDQATGVVTLRGAVQTVEMTVHNPDQLKLIHVGDQIQAVTTQVLALSLEPVKK